MMANIKTAQGKTFFFFPLFQQDNQWIDTLIGNHRGAAGYLDKEIFGLDHIYQTPTCKWVYQTGTCHCSISFIFFFFFSSISENDQQNSSNQPTNRSVRSRGFSGKFHINLHLLVGRSHRPCAVFLSTPFRASHSLDLIWSFLDVVGRRSLQVLSK